MAAEGGEKTGTESETETEAKTGRKRGRGRGELAGTGSLTEGGGITATGVFGWSGAGACSSAVAYHVCLRVCFWLCVCVGCGCGCLICDV